ncbi:hypothetical protein DSO57_1021408 [Entomophthora muscae]|uniref:Uncharacterized protein n=1 Tax=Entomophthora muscae TaxID=34485 RepID=A0ACC2SGE3_9FUNG|nr:hypothetical protein DSO57_1021408 [Entomophthora muscae]
MPRKVRSGAFLKRTRLQCRFKVLDKDVRLMRIFQGVILDQTYSRPHVRRHWLGLEIVVFGCSARGLIANMGSLMQFPGVLDDIYTLIAGPLLQQSFSELCLKRGTFRFNTLLSSLHLVMFSHSFLHRVLDLQFLSQLRLSFDERSHQTLTIGSTNHKHKHNFLEQVSLL